MSDQREPVPALFESEEGAGALAACPHLVSVDGPWHAASPSRAHRCRLLKAGRPTLERQRLHCLGSSHVDCPTWLEAHGPQGRPATPGPFVATAPVVLEGPGIGISSRGAARRLAAPVTVIVAGVALGALLLSRGPLAPGSPGAGGATPTATPIGSLEPGGTPGFSAGAATPAPTATPMPAATAAPTVTPTNASRPQTYTVRSGDTLTSIAAEFGTTTRKLAKLNNIENPSLIRVGQELLLP